MSETSERYEERHDREILEREESSHTMPMSQRRSLDVDSIEDHSESETESDPDEEDYLADGEQDGDAERAEAERAADEYLVEPEAEVPQVAIPIPSPAPVEEVPAPEEPVEVPAPVQEDLPPPPPMEIPGVGGPEMLMPIIVDYYTTRGSLEESRRVVSHLSGRLGLPLEGTGQIAPGVDAALVSAELKFRRILHAAAGFSTDPMLETIIEPLVTELMREVRGIIRAKWY